MRTLWIVTMAIVFAAGGGAWAQVPITACGQTVGMDELGVLNVDLTCPTSDPFAVAVDIGGRLDLAGHTISGASYGIRCAKRCTISSTGPAGTVKDSLPGLGAGIIAESDAGRLTVANVIVDNHSVGLLTNVDHGKVIAAGLTLTNNGLGMQGRKIRATGLTASGNFTVAQSRKTILNDSTVTASGDSAFKGRTFVSIDASVTGSGSGIDLLTERMPRLMNSTCGVSRKLQNPTETWGVCAND